MKIEQAKNIHIDNISEFSSRIVLAEEQRTLAVSELAELFIENLSSASPQESYAEFLRSFPKSRPQDRAKFLSKLMSGRKNDLSLWYNKSTKESATFPGSHGKIAVVKNNYSESAILLLSKTVIRPKVISAQNFSDACESVVDNKCQFCILPTETSAGGRLFGFYSMLDRYELKIFALCSVETDDGTGSVKYALVGRSMPDRFPRATERTLECSVITENGKFPSDIPNVLDIFGAKLLRVDSLPTEYDELQNKYYLSFRMSEKNAIVMDLYLSVEYPNYSQIGLYPTI
ncbi:MAG: hypothetical protein E7607_03845 [Ruminococcaceae bacterium]|nr:hypothetical protein [Oscillospiraceae bacterium]